jgi:hypothetical protein
MKGRSALPRVAFLLGLLVVVGGVTGAIWGRGLETHPLIRDAEIKRSGLRGLRLIVSEVEPLALVSAPELRAVRGDGALLPIDPTRTPLDLPLVAISAQVSDDSTHLADGPALEALRIFAQLQALDPGLAALVSDFELAADHGLMVNMVESQPVQSIVLPAEFDEMLVKRVRATLSDLRTRGIAATEMEARYANQIVVRRQQA